MCCYKGRYRGVSVVCKANYPGNLFHRRVEQLERLCGNYQNSVEIKTGQRPAVVAAGITP